MPTTEEGDGGMGTPRLGAGSRPASTTVRSNVRARRRLAHPLTSVALGVVTAALMVGPAAIPATDAGAAARVSVDNKAFAQAQLVKLSNLPAGWTASGGTWVGTSADDDASSMLTMTQYPEYSTCLGQPPELSVVATEASSPEFYSKDQNTNVLDVADVYATTSEAKTDFPPLTNPKFAGCFLKVQSSSIMSVEQSDWPTGATFGTPIASVSRQPRYGSQSGLIEVEVPVTLPGGEGSTNDFIVALVIRQGRSTAELLFDQGATTPSAALTESLAKAVTAKMKARPPDNAFLTA
jgi:hypothetical protein